MTDEYDIPERDREDLSDDGYDSATMFDAEAAYRAARIFSDNGYFEKAESMLAIGESAVNYWTQLIQDVAGKSVYFNESDMRWHDGDNNMYVKDPYCEIQQDQYELEMYILNRYGEF